MRSYDAAHANERQHYEQRRVVRRKKMRGEGTLYYLRQRGRRDNNNFRKTGILAIDFRITLT